MGKTKPSSKAPAAKAASPVKNGGVTKSSQKPANKAKELAKTAAAKALPGKKSKKAESESEDSGSDISDSPASSEADSDESDDEDVAVPTKVAASKTNGTAKAAADDSEEDSDDSEGDSDGSDDSEDDEVEAPTKGAAKVNGVAKTNGTAADEDDTSDESESSDDEVPAPKGVKTETNGAADSDDEEEDDDSSADASSDDDDEDEEEAPSKKRKADETATPASKKTRTAPETPSAGEGVKNLFVGGLSWNVDEEWLAREFEGFGELASCRLITDRESGKSKGFGYVEFGDPAHAAAALEAMNGAMIDGRGIRVDFSTPRPQKDDSTPRDRASQRANKFGDSQGEPSDTLFLGNLSFDVTNDLINEAFESFGTVTRVTLPTDRDTGNPKGFGYISFSAVEESKAAYEAMFGQEIAGRRLRLDYAQPRDSNGGGGGGRGGRGGGFGGDRGGRWERGGGGGFGGRGGRGGFGDRGRGGRGGRGDRGGRGGRGGTTNRGGYNDFKGSKVSFD